MFGLGAPELLIILTMGFIFVVIPLAIVLLVVSSRRKSRGDALTILDDRLARGELSPDEYDERRSRLI